MNSKRIGLNLKSYQAKNISLTRLLGKRYQGRKIKSIFDEETSKREKNGSQECMLLERMMICHFQLMHAFTA